MTARGLAARACVQLYNPPISRLASLSAVLLIGAGEMILRRTATFLWQYHRDCGGGKITMI